MRLLDSAPHTTTPTDHAADPRWQEETRRIAQRWGSRNRRLADEFESEAYVALVQAAKTYEPSKGASFRVHFHTRVNGAMMSVARQWKPQGYRRTGDQAPATESLSATHAEGGDAVASDDSPVGWEAEFHDELASLTKGLTKQQAKLIRLLYGQAAYAKQVHAAKGLGVGEMRACQVCAQAIQELRRIHGVSTDLADDTAPAE